MTGEAGDGEAGAIAERVLALVGDRAEAVASVSRGTSSLTRFANSRIHQNVTEDTAVVVVTVAREGGRVARASTNRVGGDALADLVERALAAAALRPPDADFPGFAPAGPVAAVDHWDDATAGATPDQRAELVAAFVAAGGGAGDGGRGRDGGGGGGALEAAGYCATRATERVLASTTGQRAAGRSTVAEVDGIFRAATSGRPADGAAQATSARLADLDGAACGRRAAAKARGGLDAVGLAPGSYEVVLEPRAVAAALTYPAYLGFNGKAHAEGTSFVHLGEQQWDAAVAIWDDATDPRAVGLPFDPEGTPKGRVDLVRAGVSTGLAHDRRSAAAAGVAPTGNSVGAESEGGFPTDLFLARRAGLAGGPGGRGRAGAAGHRLLVQPHPRPQDPGRHRPHPQRAVPGGGRRASSRRSRTCATPSRSWRRSGRVGCSGWATTRGSRGARAASCTCRLCASQAGRSRATRRANFPST